MTGWSGSFTPAEAPAPRPLPQPPHPASGGPPAPGAGRGPGAQTRPGARGRSARGLEAPPPPPLWVREGGEAPAGPCRHTGVRGGALTGAVTQGQGRVVVGQGAEVLGLHVHQGGPGEGHVVPDGRLGHGLMHQPVLGRHLLAHTAGWWGLPRAQRPGPPPLPTLGLGFDQSPSGPAPGQAELRGRAPVPALIGVAPEAGTQDLGVDSRLWYPTGGPVPAPPPPPRSWLCS